MGTRSARSIRLVDRLLNRATVVEVSPMGARMRRIRLQADEIRDLRWTPGQQVRILVGSVDWKALRGGFRDLLRTYSVYDLDRDGGCLDLCVLDHGDGPGAQWSRRVQPGDDVHFGGPEGQLTVDPAASFHLFIGEETASVAFGAMTRCLPSASKVLGVIEVSGSADRLEIARAGDIDWLFRGDAPAASSASLIAAVTKLELPETPGHAYVAGESKVCAAVRRHLVEDRGWPGRGAITVKPFWTPGKKGLE
jgi:NADPH-dependent ferric siderophore reductase